MIETLTKYINSGLKCLPVKQDKSPDIKASWLNGIDDVSLYKNGIGIICGEASNGLECLDFDNHFGDAKETLSFFIEEIKELYEKYKFPIPSTQSGGFHLIYRCEFVEGNKKLASKPMLRGNKWVPDAIIETRGQGGYFVAAPTNGYKWQRNNPFDVQEITKEEREIIIQTAKSFNKWEQVIKEVNESKDKPGDKFNNDIYSKSEMISCLTSHGWFEIKQGIWRRPGKKQGISATIGKIADNIFYNFSSNAYPFEPNKAYTPFQVIALLDYNSDFKEFARDLAKRYEETKPEKKIYAKEETKPTENLDEVLQSCLIDTSIPVKMPPIAVKINDFYKGSIYRKRLFTLGNFSAITGKSKSKKSMLTSILLAASVSNGSIYKKVEGCLPESKRGVCLFDTEQSTYDAYIGAKRILDILGSNFDNFGAFKLRSLTPLQRCEIIDYAFEKFKGQLGYVVIDGIVDLANSNDELEAIRVQNLLMKWTEIYNCHITVVIHQNKNDNYATGHIGSAILKKSEVIISVTKDVSEPMISKVSCDMIRGTSDFNDFNIEIQENGIPIIQDLINTSSNYEIKDLPF